MGGGAHTREEKGKNKRRKKETNKIQELRYFQIKCGYKGQTCFQTKCGYKGQTCLQTKCGYKGQTCLQIKCGYKGQTCLQTKCGYKCQTCLQIKSKLCAFSNKLFDYFLFVCKKNRV